MGSGFGFRVQGSGFMVSDFGFSGVNFGIRVWGLGFGFRVLGLGFRVSGFGFWIEGLRLRVSGLGFGVSGIRIPRFRISGFRVSGQGSKVKGLRFGVASPRGRRPAARPTGMFTNHPRGNSGANLQSISHRCYLQEVAFEWELTKETIYLSLGCLQGGSTTRFHQDEYV